VAAALTRTVTDAHRRWIGLRVEGISPHHTPTAFPAALTARVWVYVFFHIAENQAIVPVFLL